MTDDLIYSHEDIDVLTVLAIECEDNGFLERAISLYRIGAVLGDLVCMTRLADVLSEPPEYRDVSLAKTIYTKACLLGHAPACTNLAVLYGQLGMSDMYIKYMNIAKNRGDIWQNDD